MFRLATTRVSRRFFSSNFKPPPKPNLKPHETPQDEAETVTNRIHKRLSELNLVTQTDINDLFREMEKRRYNVTKVKWYFGLFAGTMILISGRQIKNFLSSKTSEVTQQSMDDPEFQEKVTELSSKVANEVLQRMLKDEKLEQQIQAYTAQILKKSVIQLYRDPEFIQATKAAAGDLVTSRLITDRSTKLSREVAQRLLEDPEIKKKLGNTMKTSFVFGFLPTYFHSSDLQEPSVEEAKN